MIASVYDLEAIRSQRNSATDTATYYQTRMVPDGLALILAATSFWVEFAVATAWSQVGLMSLLSSPDSKLPRATDRR